MQWVGHVERSDGRKKIMVGVGEGKGKRGRPKNRWENCVNSVICIRVKLY